MAGNPLSNTPRRSCEYSNGRISRRYLTRTLTDPQHHIRTDRIGSRHFDWRRKDTVDLQCASKHTKNLIREREDKLWETNRMNRHGVDPLANIIGWYSGHIDQKAWLDRKVHCYRLKRPASELRNKHSALHKAYQKAKAQREAQEGGSANVLTEHEQSRIKSTADGSRFLIMVDKRKKADLEAKKQKEVRVEELKSILAALATVVPPPIKDPDPTSPQMHRDRLARMASSAPLYQLDARVTKNVRSQAEGRRRLKLKAWQTKAKSEGRSLENEKQQQDDPRGCWQSLEYDLV